MHVLIVEDNRQMARMLRSMLAAAGLRDITIAEGVAEALDACHARPPDLAVIDHELPDGVGTDLVRRLRTEPSSPCPTMAVVMCTAHAHVSKVRAAIDAGANEFLCKPVSPASLITRIRAVTANPRPYVRTTNFFGPDRRRSTRPHFAGPYRRVGDM